MSFPWCRSTARGTGDSSADLLREVVTRGGLCRFRRTSETPFNRGFDARR